MSGRLIKHAWRSFKFVAMVLCAALLITGGRGRDRRGSEIRRSRRPVQHLGGGLPGGVRREPVGPVWFLQQERRLQTQTMR